VASEYKFTVSMPWNSALPRDRITNTFVMQHVTGGIDNSALKSMTDDIAAMYQKRYHDATKEIVVKAYDNDAKPNLPRATTSVNSGVLWTRDMPHEVALCLSFAGSYRGDRRGRGRLYLAPQLDTAVGSTLPQRPTTGVMDWALDFYRVPNESFPDLGGIDWKFGIWSRVGQHFTQAQQAWVDDEWDTQRSRGLRETTRVSATREG
jgi:hypothetical protein